MQTYDATAVDELSASFHLEREEGARDNTYLRISGIGDCRRKLGYRITSYKAGLPELPTWTHGLVTFDIGHKLHLGLQHRMSNAGPMKWVDADPVVKNGEFGFKGNFEVPLVDHDLKVRGTLDALTRPLKKVKIDADGKVVERIVPTEEDDPDGKRYIIDIKTITARQRMGTNWKGQQVLWDSPFEKLKEAKPEHLSQANFYSYLTTQKGFKSGKLKKPLEKAPDVMILYVAKDLDPDYYAKHPELYEDPAGLLNSPFKIFTVPSSNMRVKASLRKVAEVWSHLDAGELPPRDYYHTPDKPAWPCVWCPYRHECYKAEGYFSEETVQEPIQLTVRKGTYPVEG